MVGSIILFDVFNFIQILLLGSEEKNNWPPESVKQLGKVTMANLYNKKPLTRDQLKLAKENSKSAMGAARYLKVSYNTFVK